MHIHDDNNNNREKRGEKREKAWFLQALSNKKKEREQINLLFYLRAPYGYGKKNTVGLWLRIPTYQLSMKTANDKRELGCHFHMNDSHVVISETKSFDIWKYTEKSLRDNGWNMYSPLYLALCHTFITTRVLSRTAWLWIVFARPWWKTNAWYACVISC